jgi:hypothetical protein
MVGCESWFTVRTTPSTTPSEHELADLRGFRHITDEPPRLATNYKRKCRAFNNKDKRKMDIMDWKKVFGALKRAEDLDEAAIEWASRQLKALEVEEKSRESRTGRAKLTPCRHWSREIPVERPPAGPHESTECVALLLRREQPILARPAEHQLFFRLEGLQLSAGPLSRGLVQVL